MYTHVKQFADHLLASYTDGQMRETHSSLPEGYEEMDKN